MASRSDENIQPEDIIVLRPGQSAPPVVVVYPDGSTTTYDEFLNGEDSPMISLPDGSLMTRDDYRAWLDSFKDVEFPS